LIIENLMKIANWKLKIGLAITLFLFPIVTDAATIARPMHNSGLVGLWSMEEGKVTDIIL